MTSTQSPWTRLMGLISTVMLALLLAACGGSGAGAGGGSSSTLAASKAAELSLISDVTSLGSDGKKTATITAIVKSELNVALASQGVTFSTNDAGATLVVSDDATDDSGQVEATLSVTDRSVRTIVVTAEAGSLIRTISIPVVGTVLQINGSSTIVFNAETQYSASLRDSSGEPIIGAPISVVSSNGNTVSPAVATTDTQGQAIFNVTGVNSGNDNLSATAQGVTTVFPTSVSTTQLSYLTPGDGADITVDVATPVSVRLVESGSAVSGTTVRFTVTRGDFVGSEEAVTNGNGDATVQVSSANAGITTITATQVIGGASSGVTATREIEFISKTPSKIELQASPTVVGANLSSDGTNASQLIAVVRDDNDNPVKNARVDFTALSDPSNGRVEPAYGITDSFGTATASFIAGPTATGFEGVTLQARLSGDSSISSTATVTVSQLELSVRIGTGNEMVDDGSLTTYTMPWTSLVADSSGNPVANAGVTVALQSVRYLKGERAWNGNAWAKVDPITYCASEDDNLNSRLDPGEDDAASGGNGNNELDPGAVAVASLESGSTTDSSGLASIMVTYPKSYGGWVEVRLRVTITTVSGTEATAERTFILPVSGADLATQTTPPPGSTAPTSPFGASTDCTTTL